MLSCWRAAFHDSLVAMLSKSRPSKARNCAGFRRYDSPKLGRQGPKLGVKTVSRKQS